MPSRIPFSDKSPGPHMHLGVGLIGFGAFGQLMAGHLAPHFRLCIYDGRASAMDDAMQAGFDTGTITQVAQCDVVILSVPVSAMAQVIDTIASHIRPGAIVMDVGSVKMEPARLMAAGLPAHAELIGLHPLFGPQSAATGLSGLKLALCPIRADRGLVRSVAAFLRHVLKLQVFCTSPEDHDREAAITQGITHLVARVLLRMEPLPSRLTTRSFDHLMAAVDMVRHDAPEVFLAIENQNPFAAAMREQFFDLATGLRDELRANHPPHDMRPDHHSTQVVQ